MSVTFVQITDLRWQIIIIKRSSGAPIYRTGHFTIILTQTRTHTHTHTHTLLRIGWGMGTAVKTDVSDICVDNWALLTDVWWHSSRELSMANACQWHSCQELGAVGRLLTGISDRYSATKEQLLLSDVKDTAVESGRLLESKERKKPPMLLQRDAC